MHGRISNALLRSSFSYIEIEMASIDHAMRECAGLVVEIAPSARLISLKQVLP